MEPDKDMATLRDLPSANTGSPLKDQACETLWGGCRRAAVWHPPWAWHDAMLMSCCPWCPNLSSLCSCSWGFPLQGSFFSLHFPLVQTHPNATPQAPFLDSCPSPPPHLPRSGSRQSLLWCSHSALCTCQRPLLPRTDLLDPTILTRLPTHTSIP